MRNPLLSLEARARLPGAGSIRGLLLGLAVATAAALAAVFVVAALAVANVLHRVERDQVSSSVERGRQVLGRRLRAHLLVAQEYAFWDDTWRYVDRPRGPGADRFIRDNFTNWLPRQYGYHFIGIWARGRSPVLEWSDSTTPGIARDIPDHPLLDLVDRRRSVSGFLRAGTTFLMLAGAVVAHTEDLTGSGPSNGYLVLALTVTDSVLEELGRELGQGVRLRPFTGPPPGDTAASRVVAEGDSVETSVPLRDVFGTPVGMLVLSGSRASIRDIQRWLFTFFLSAGLGGVLLLLLLYVAGNRLVVRLVDNPLRHIASAFEHMEETGQLETIERAPPSREWALLVSGFNRTVEALRASEAQLRQAQKMEAIGSFAGGIAHDFNNLLTTILATVELLRDELPAGARAGPDLESIQHAGESGAELTRKMLAFSRRQQLEVRNVAVEDVVADFAKLVRRMLREDIELALHTDRRKTVVRADPGALEQVLLNLVTNARDAMPQGGKIVIATGRETLDELFRLTHGWGAPGEYAVLAVSDTGAGMNEVTQQRVFEPFFTTKPVGAGTGLGMAMVYGLVKQHDGFVHVYSEVGRGTTVKIYLPAHAEAVAEAWQHPPAAAVRGGAETILVVEDEASLRQAAKRVLQKYGYNVLVAADGAEGLQMYEEHDPEIALIVSDVVMPRLGGPELIAALRSKGKMVPILLMSGYAAGEIERVRRVEPNQPYLAKPWTIQDLLRRVREVLDGTLDTRA